MTAVTIQQSSAEGSFQVGLNQPFVETNATAPGAASIRDILIDVMTAGEVINISACGAADSNILAFVIETPSGSVLPTYTPTAAAGKISCTNTMTSPITTPYRYVTTAAGRYKLRLINVTAANFNRFDITVTASTAINPDPTNASGIKGRVSSLSWQYSTGAFSLASATDANYYVLTPGGYPGTNYVWQLDLNALAGNGYSIAANNRGVNAPRSGFSTDVAGNAVVAQFQNYINYPAIAGPPPSSAPAVSGFRFIDNAGQDYGISPGSTTGVQDSGFFEFTAPVDNATYSISIDVNKNGIFGDAGDVRLTGNVANGFNSISWDGKNNSGTVLPVGSYQARAEVRLGEFHFIANDVETSGGTQNGLTVYEALSPTNVVPTRVYWDDITVLGVAAGGTANTPIGALSGTAAGYHSWGNFDAGGGGFGNNRFVDTFAFGATTQASLFVAITTVDTPLTGSDGNVTITPSSKPGDLLSLSVTDADLNSLSTIVETVLVSVRNNVTGETEAVTLTETGINTSVFTGSLPTAFGAVAGANNTGTLATQAGDTLTVTYSDALSATGSAVSRTANDAVSGGNSGTVSITPTAGPGDTLLLGVTDADLNLNASAIETVIVPVVNSSTGESELVTLTETGPNTGAFSGSLATVSGSVAGTNDDGTLNVKPADTIVATYSDSMTVSGGPAAPIASSTINAFNALVATNDSATGIDATAGASNVLNTFDGDSVNGVAADPTNAVLTIAAGSAVPSGLTFDTATGNVSVVAGTTAATYSFVYQICEQANLVNCKTAVVSVSVAIPVAPIVATNDAVSGINGVSGAANVVNALTGDTINGAAATTTNAVLSVATGFTVPASLIFDIATGAVSVNAGTAAGTYSFDYQICEAANPGNCASASIGVTVEATVAQIITTNDTATGINGASGASNVANAFTGDTINAVAATAANASLLVAPGFTVPVGLTFDATTGAVGVEANTPAGIYGFDYQICEAAAPLNCATATVSVTVIPSPVVATDNSVVGINGATGAGAAVNVFTGDTVNAVSANSTNAILSVASGSTLPPGLLFDTATGDVGVAAGTPAAVYVFDYSMCERLNPANCQTAAVSVSVDPSNLIATPDSAAGVSGASGAPDVVNVFAGDTLNGSAATAANAVLTVAAGSTVPPGLTFDLSTGSVGVSASTTSGLKSFDYRICEQLNPTNCQTATVSVSVDGAALVATADTATGVNGAAGALNILNVFAGDTVNGAAATTLTTTLGVDAGSTVPAALTFDTTTGDVSVAAGTPLGVYSFDYQICERLNPANCQTATISISVDAASITAAADTIAGINGASGARNILNVLIGDSVNAVAASTSNVLLSVATGSTVPTDLSFDIATGNVSVLAGSPAGTYRFNYQICEMLNPANCQTAAVTVGVDPSAIIAVNIGVNNINGAAGAANVANAFNGNSINDIAATAANALLSVAAGSSVPSGLSFDTNSGNISVTAATPAGTYSFNYQICEALNPTNCRIATVSVAVDSSLIVATPDSVSAINGASGAGNVVNAFGGDFVGATPATAANAILSIAPGSTVPTGLVFDVASGAVSVTAQTPAGTYAFDYQLCERLNPANCGIATISVNVAASIVVATADAAAGVNGTTGASNVINVFSGDSIDGGPATATNAVIGIAPGGAVPTGLTFDVVTGDVSVAAGTSAGGYLFDYQLCEALNPTNCKTAAASVTVDAANVLVTADTASSINGASGAANVLNVFAGDTINGAAATPSNAIISIAAGARLAPGLTFDASSGNVSISPGTAAGTYGFTYQLCETLNPTNCGTASVSVVVDASALTVATITASGINGASGASAIANGFSGNSVNSTAATSINAELSVAAGSNVPSGLVFDTGTGDVGVVAGTAAGTYTFAYQLCERLNPANCRTATISVAVDAAGVVAMSDTVTGINGATGAAGVMIVYAGDTVNDAAAAPSNSTLSLAPGSTVPAGLIFDVANGAVSVAPATAAGIYGFSYQICERLNSGNCTTAAVSVTVDVSPITMVNGSASAINGATGAVNVANVYTGNSVNGDAATSANANASLAVGSTVPPGLTFDTAVGTVSVPPGTAAGTYTLNYQLCENLNPTNCRTAMISVSVDAAAITVTNSAVSDVNGVIGAATVINVLTGNLINGGAASTANTLISLAPGKSVPAGVTFDARTGDVGVAAGTADGTYIIEYQLCEALNPTNCGVAAISVAVVNASPSASPDTATVVRGNSVTINVLANDNEPGGDPITVRSTTTPANGIVTINGDSTLTFTPNASFTGADSFRYTVCDPARQCASADVNVTVQSSVAAITGTVFLNTDGNQTMDPSDPHQPNWLVEVVRNNAVIATARTDADGRYEITDLPLGSGYSLLLQHPTTRVVYARSDQITLNAGISSIVLNRPIDPSGVIYDSIARTAIAGARVSIADANGTLLPSSCVLDPSQQNQLTASDGRYRIDIIAGAAVQCPVGETVYRLVVTGPADTIDGRSTVILADTGPFDPTGLSSAAVAPNSAAPQAGESTRHFFTFRLASGDPDVTNNHVPLDRAGALNPLIVTVTSPKRTANVGDLVPYTIVVRNTQNVARTAIDLIDTVPPGFKYVRDSGLINATPIAPEANGRDIAWRKLTLPANGSLTISLMLTIGAGVNDGDYVNSAVSRDSRQANVVSNVGQATVRVAPSPLFDCAEIIGKVFEDANGNGVQDDGEPGIASARVATVNGLLITADQYGRYHITCASVPNAQIGSNFILKLDPRSLPSGHRITTENPRVIRLTRGKISELNFGAQATRVTTIDLSSVAFIGETTALTPDWHAKLPALIANLKATGSTLQLLYVGTPGEEGRATERLTALARQLEALWRKTGRSGDLLIERTFISANLTPTTITGKE